MSIHGRCVTSVGRSSIVYSKLSRAHGPWAFGGSLGERLRWLLLLPLWLPSRTQIAQFFGLRSDSPWVPLACLVNPLRWAWRIVSKALGRWAPMAARLWGRRRVSLAAARHCGRPGAGLGARLLLPLRLKAWNHRATVLNDAPEA